MTHEQHLSYLIRLLMVQAAFHSGMHPRQLSFKHIARLWSEWVALRLVSLAEAPHGVLFRAIAKREVGNPPGRLEPHARK